jgi:pyruvate kinase
VGTAERAYVAPPESLRDVKVGDQVLMDDGMIQLRVEETTPDEVRCRVIQGGRISDHKGLSLPRVPLPVSCLSDKDRHDLRFGIEQGVDFVAISFVRSAADVAEVRRFLAEQGAGLPIVAKLERQEAMENLPDILATVEAVMVARGDLGVDVPLEELPHLQKEIIRQARLAKVPVIVATQMLESMVTHLRPTRAEVSDVATAIFDGADAVMLSAETAVGDYPVEAVEAMDRIIREMERSGPGREERRMERMATGAVTVEDAIALGTHAVARMLRTPLIVTLTKGGFTARKVAATRPPVPIMAVTTEPVTFRQLALVWGIVPVRVDRVPGYDAMLGVVRDLILRRGYAAAGDRIVMTAGVPWEVSGSTNLIKVEVV